MVATLNLWVLATLGTLALVSFVVVAANGHGVNPLANAAPQPPSNIGGLLPGGDTSPEDNEFEREIEAGGCREEFIETLKSRITQVIVNDIPQTDLPIDQEMRPAIAKQVSKLVGDQIKEHATGANAAEATATVFVMVCTSQTGVPPACNAARPLVRRAALEVFKSLCRASECCKAPETTTRGIGPPFF